MYEIVFVASAEKDLYNLPKKMLEKTLTAIADLAQIPRPAKCKELKGHKDLWRIRIGDYRVVYAIEDVILLVDIRAVGHRSAIYK